MNRYGHGHNLKVRDSFFKVLKLKLIHIQFKEKKLYPSRRNNCKG